MLLRYTHFSSELPSASITSLMALPTRPVPPVTMTTFCALIVNGLLLVRYKPNPMVAGLCSFARGRERVTLCAPATVSGVGGHEIGLVLHPGVFCGYTKVDKKQIYRERSDSRASQTFVAHFRFFLKK